MPNLTIYPGQYAYHQLTDIFVYNRSTGGENVFIANGSGGFIANSRTGGTFVTGSDIYLGDFDGNYTTDLFFYRSSDGYNWMLYGAFNANGTGSWTNGHSTGTFSPGFTVFPGRYHASNYTDIFLYRSSDGSTWLDFANGSGYWSSPQPSYPTWLSSLNISTGHFNTGTQTYTDLFIFNPNTDAAWVELAVGDGRWNCFGGPDSGCTGSPTYFVPGGLYLREYDLT